jgi:tetratricopeptide (TPR) repeat protein
MQKDQWGHALTTDSADAAQALDRAIDSYIGWRTDVMDHLGAAIAADPDFALPHVAKGILMCGLRKPELNSKAEALLATAHASRPAGTERERRYIAALAAAIAGNVTEAASHYEAIARAHPHDLFALRLSQFELFWIGEVGWMRDISERAAPNWSPAVPGYAGYLSIRAFGLEENGAYAEAERHGRAAVALEPGDCWGAHAVAHVLVMQGRLKDGVDWISGLTGNWGGRNHIQHHNWWHLALFHTEAGEYDAALEIYDSRLRDLGSPLMKAIPDFYVDIQNDVALLQRLELRGVDVGGRWEPLAELARPRIGNHTSPFTSAHCALALAAAGEDADAAGIVAAMRDFVGRNPNTLAPRYALAALPASEAAVAYRRGDFQRVIDVLTPARRNLWQMGGSHAQRDLFFQLLADAALKLGRTDLLATLFDDFDAIGIEHAAERSSYADAMAALH